MADTSVNNVSGGVNLNANTVHVDGDVVGRDKITSIQYPPQPALLQQLRRPPDCFFGREAEFNALRVAIEKQGQTIIGIFGMGGVGKTALALKLADYFTQRYPDAQIQYNFDSNKDLGPESIDEAMLHVVTSFTREFQRPRDRNTLIAAYQSALAGKRALLLMDDVTFVKNIEQLIPQGSSCLVLFTSRKRFSLLNYQIHSQNLSVLNSQHSCDLLLAMTSRAGNQVKTIAELCGHLPLALRVAGTFLAVETMRPETYVQELRDERKRLKRLDGVEASIGVSYQHLHNSAKKVFRELGVFPASFDEDAQEPVCDDAASVILHTLVQYSLVDRLAGSGWKNEAGRIKKVDRFQLHDLVRIFAHSHLNSKHAHYIDLQCKHAEHYEKILRKADLLYLEGGETAIWGLDLFKQDFKNIEVGHDWAASNLGRDDRAAMLCSKFAEGGKDCIALRLSPEDQLSWRKSALVAARRLGNWAEASVHEGELGNIDAGVGEPASAINHYEQQLSRARQLGDRIGGSDALGNLGNAYSDLGQIDKAIDFYQQQRALASELKDRYKEHVALANLAGAYILNGDDNQALSILEERLIMAREFRDTQGETIILINLGLISFRQSDFGRAAKLYREARSLAHKIGDRRNEGNASWNMSLCAKQKDDYVRAIRYAEEALALFMPVGDPHALEVQETLTIWREGPNKRT